MDDVVIPYLGCNGIRIISLRTLPPETSFLDWNTQAGDLVEGRLGRRRLGLAGDLDLGGRSLFLPCKDGRHLALLEGSSWDY